ncbi:MAG: DUF1467 family protein [Alphaproteobacteria bacterium]
MGWASGAVVYIIIWWLVLFLTLPIGVRPPHEVGEEAQPGNEAGAPVKSHIRIKIAATSLIAAILWGGAYWLIDSDLISFRGG